MVTHKSMIDVVVNILLALLIAFAIALGALLAVLIVLWTLHIVTVEQWLTGDVWFILKPSTLPGLVLFAAPAVGFVSSALLMRRVCKKKGARWRLGWVQEGAARYAMRGVGLGMLLSAAVGLGIWVTGTIRISSATAELQVLLHIFLALLVYIVVAVNEEIFSRGFVQGVVAEHYGPNAGIIVSSLLYALLHFSNNAIWGDAIPMTNLFLVGILLALCRVASGGLWLPIGIHIGWLFVQGSVLGFPISGLAVDSLLILDISGPDVLSGGRFGVEGSAVTTMILALGVLIADRWTFQARNTSSVWMGTLFAGEKRIV